MSQKPTYPNNRLEQSILLIIAVIMMFAGYCAGRASLHRDVIEVEAGQ